MKSALSVLRMAVRLKLSGMSLGLTVVLLTTALAGCSSVISNSEGFYKDIPRRPINWREYMTD